MHLSLLRLALGSAPLWLAASALAQTPVRVSPWTVVSEQKISSTQGGLGLTLGTNAYFGLALGTLGDLDGDGLAELLIGAPGANLGGLGRGEVFVLFLHPNGTVRAKQVIGQSTGGFAWPLDDDDYFGRSVWGLGDLDNDGVEDAIAGAYRDDDGSFDAGAAYVLFLNANGTVKASTKIANGRAGFTPVLSSGDLFGVRSIGIGDLDGDGREDAVVSAPFSNDGGTDRGSIFVLFLNMNGTVKATQKISHTAGNLGVALDDFDIFGTALAPLGDLDGDGVMDIACAARGDDDGGNGRGAVYILFLNPNGTVKARQKISDTQGGFRGELSDADNFGISTLAILPHAGPNANGSVSGNGRVTLAVGAFEDDDGGTNRGAVWLLDLDGDGRVLGHRKISDTAGGFGGVLQNNDGFGTGLAHLGDLDGDGRPNVGVGAWADSDGGVAGGAAWILNLDGDPGLARPGPGTVVAASATETALGISAPRVAHVGAPLVLSVTSEEPEALQGAGVLVGFGGVGPAGIAGLEVVGPYAFVSGARVELEVPERVRLLGGAIGVQAVAWRGARLELSRAVGVGLPKE